MPLHKFATAQAVTCYMEDNGSATQSPLSTSAFFDEIMSYDGPSDDKKVVTASA
jgi:hypothetical protein